MSEENGCEVMETIDEIVREMRIIGSIEEKSTDKIPSGFQSPGLRMFADRIEDAAKRELEAGADAVQICGENAENETIADIVSEMREFADTDSQTIGRDVLRKRIKDFSRRIEQSVTDCNQFGNAAAMREALEKTQSVIATCMEILNKIPDGCDYDGLVDEVADELCDLRDSHVKAALSAPPRNCDVGTADEQAKRFHSFCKKFQSCIQEMCSPLCPFINCCDVCHCMTKWLQMPYKEGEK